MIDSAVIFALVAFVPWITFAYYVNKFRTLRLVRREEASLLLETLHAFINLAILAFNLIGAFVVFKWVGGFFFG